MWGGNLTADVQIKKNTDPPLQNFGRTDNLSTLLHIENEGFTQNRKKEVDNISLKSLATKIKAIMFDAT